MLIYFSCVVDVVRRHDLHALQVDLNENIRSCKSFSNKYPSWLYRRLFVHAADRFAFQFEVLIKWIGWSWCRHDPTFSAPFFGRTGPIGEQIRRSVRSVRTDISAVIASSGLDGPSRCLTLVDYWSDFQTVEWRSRSMRFWEGSYIWEID
jgi:hypothetical protein